MLLKFLSLSLLRKLELTPNLLFKGLSKFYFEFWVELKLPWLLEEIELLLALGCFLFTLFEAEFSVL